MSATPRQLLILSLMGALNWPAAGLAADAGGTSPDTDGGVAQAIAAAEADLARHDRDAAQKTMHRLSARIPAQSVGAVEAWEIGLLHVRAGLDSEARPWFQRVNDIASGRKEAAGPLATGAHAPRLAEPLAAALLGLGKQEQAVDVLNACNRERPAGADRCGPWLMVELAAARGHWRVVAQVMDPWLERGLKAPASALQWRLRAAMEIGDDASVGRFRLAVLKTGGQLPRAPAAPAQTAPEPPSTGSAGIIVGGLFVLLLLLCAALLAWRLNR